MPIYKLTLRRPNPNDMGNMAHLVQAFQYAKYSRHAHVRRSRDNSELDFELGTEHIKEFETFMKKKRPHIGHDIALSSDYPDVASFYARKE